MPVLPKMKWRSVWIKKYLKNKMPLLSIIIIMIVAQNQGVNHVVVDSPVFSKICKEILI